jgi:hypothetical protein
MKRTTKEYDRLLIDEKYFLDEIAEHEQAIIESKSELKAIQDKIAIELKNMISKGFISTHR